MIIDPIFINALTLNSLLSFPSLLHHLHSSLPSLTLSTHSPIRHHHTLSPPHPTLTPPAPTLLLMPSWSHTTTSPYLGVKLVTSFPHATPGINASYTLFSSFTGSPLAVMSGTEMTLWRTSCVSALASRYLSREDSEVLLMVGAGILAGYLIKAHLCVRPGLRRVVVWNRSAGKARELVERLRGDVEVREGVRFEVGDVLEEVIGDADIISCATGSTNALVRGSAMKLGAHLDLVGSFTPSMRECDDEAIKRGRVFIDSEAALVEAGELVGISEEDISGNLVNLITGDKVGRITNEELTVFKSVGSAVVDIATAQFVYESFLHRKDDL